MSGLVALGNFAVSGASTAIDNIFSSAYEDYQILFEGICSGANSALYITFRSGGSDVGSTNHNWQYMESATTTAASRTASTNKILVGAVDDANRSSASFIVFSPFATEEKRVIADAQDCENTVRLLCSVGWTTSLTSSCDGFKISVSSFTVTGTIWVYGYAQS